MAGVHNVAHVRFPVAVQGCGNTDDDDVGSAEIAHRAGAAESWRRGEFADRGGIDVVDVARAGGEGRDLGGVCIEAGDAKTTLVGCQGEGKANITQANDGNMGIAGGDARRDVCYRAHVRSRGCARMVVVSIHQPGW